MISNANYIPTVNNDARPNNTVVDLIVIHSISLPPGKFGDNHVEDFFCNKLDRRAHPYFKQIAHLHVSAHLFIPRDGRIEQFVSFHKRAWHAGESSYQGRDDCNSYSIGIELEGINTIPYTGVQYETVARVCTALLHAYPDHNEQRIVGHSAISPHRKHDPGESFDWNYFRKLLKGIKYETD